MSITSYIFAGTAVAFTALLGYLSSKTSAPAANARKLGARLPPGPKQNPFLGNISNFPQEKWYLKFLEWQREFGDLVFINLNVAGVTMLVVNSLEIAEELGDRRTKVYSSRAQTTMLGDLMYTGWTLLGLSVGPKFFEQRRIAQKAVGPTAAPQYDEIIQEHIASLIKDLPSTSGDPFDAITPSLGAIIAKVAYGRNFYEKHGDDLIKLSLENMELVVSIMTKFWAVDLFPFLRHIPAWFPGAEFRRIGQRGTYMGRKIQMEPFEFVEKSMAEGTADDSLLSRFLPDSSVSRENVRDITVTMVSASVDTTSTMITHFLYAMALHPDWQKKVHNELDALIGDGRAPSFSEIEGLNYFNATWKESIRWKVVAPLVIPHATSEPDIWNGFYIPEGCIVHWNVGFMLHDPRIWGETSEEFDPGRFMVQSDLPDPTWLPFGFGRRICAGRFLAQRMAMQFAAAILSAFEVVPLKTDDGQTLGPGNTTYHEHTVRRVANFRCRYVPRHA